MSYKDFDFSGVGINNGNYFGFPFSFQDAQIVILPVEWDVTTSYTAGTANGPKAILEASTQLDFYDFDIPNAHKFGIGTLPFSSEIEDLNNKTRILAEEVIYHLENNKKPKPYSIIQVNEACEKLNNWVKNESTKALIHNKLVLLLGGDHSTSLGYIEALSKVNQEFGILQIDAHADLRQEYEGFKFSHASIMRNALQLKQITKLVQVGLRDISIDEAQFIEEEDRIAAFSDRDLAFAEFEGKTWAQSVEKIIQELPQKVYISCDIDGLSPENCPNTGTPVTGGISYNKLCYLFQKIVLSGRKIIGADLVEVSPEKNGEWNANVGARIAYKLCNFMGASNGLNPII